MESVGVFSTKKIIWLLAHGNLIGVAFFNKIVWLSFS